jgi:hypothetical protein
MSSNQGQVRVCLIYTGLGLEVARYCCHTSCSVWTEVHIDHTEYMHIYSVNGMIQESRIISTSIREFVSGSTGLGIQGRHQDWLMSHPDPHGPTMDQIIRTFRGVVHLGLQWDPASTLKPTAPPQDRHEWGYFKSEKGCLEAESGIWKRKGETTPCSKQPY